MLWSDYLQCIKLAYKGKLALLPAYHLSKLKFTQCIQSRSTRQSHTVLEGIIILLVKTVQLLPQTWSILMIHNTYLWRHVLSWYSQGGMVNTALSQWLVAIWSGLHYCGRGLLLRPTALWRAIFTPKHHYFIIKWTFTTTTMIALTSRMCILSLEVEKFQLCHFKWKSNTLFYMKILDSKKFDTVCLSK